MSLSIPLFAAAAAALAALLTGGAYFIIYRANVNRALRTGEGKPMPAPRTVLAVAAVIVFALAVFVSYLAGYKAAYDDFEGESSPAVELPPMTIRDLSALPGLLGSALEHIERDGADLTNARAVLTDLTFMDGGFSYLSFVLCYDSDGGRISRSVDVNGAGAVFTVWHPDAEDAYAQSSVPLETLRLLFAALDGVDWPADAESASFSSIYGILPQSPGGYTLSGGELVPSANSDGEFHAVDYVSGGELIRIYIPAE